MIIKTTCPYCGVGCGVDINQNSDGFTVTGDAQHPANFGKLCIKGSSLAETLGANERLTHPILNGEKASWDVVLDHISQKISSTIDHYGPDAVAMYLSGQILTEDYYVANKLMKGFIGTANVDTNSRLCMASSVVGHKRAFGEDIVPGNYEDLSLADLIIFVGSNAAWNHPVLYQRISEAKDKNPKLKVVLVDPRRTATADLADLHLQITPGTDSLLFNALLIAITNSSALNAEYISTHTQGLERALQAAELDCQDRSDLLTKLDINEADLQQFLDLFITNERAVTLYSQGINQSASGSDKVNAIINCHLASGRIGRPGMGPFSLTGQPNAMGGREVGGLANQLAAHEDFSDPIGIARIEQFWEAPNIAKQEGKKAVEMFDAIEAGDIKVIWIMGTNPVVSMPNANQIKRALAKAELVIVSEAMSHTDTLKYAHIALPASTWSEKQGTVTNSDRLISRQRGFVSPPGEAKHDWWALTQVAQRMGYASAFTYTSPVEIFREHAALSGFKNQGRRLFDISAFAEISEQNYEDFKPVRWPVNAQNPQGTERLLSSGGFTTRSGMGQFLAIRYQQPKQQPTEAYPLRLNTGRIRDQWHTMTRTGRAAKLMQHRQEPFVEIHLTDAHRFGIEEGMLARVTHENQGEAILRVRIESGQRLNELFVPMHWTDQFSRNARINQLIEPYTDPLSGQPESKQGRVKLTRVNIASYAYLITTQSLEQHLEQFVYWARVPIERGNLYILGNEISAFNWESWLNQVLGSNPSIRVQGRTATDYRAAYIQDEHLETLITVSPTYARPDLNWIMKLCGRPIDLQQRRSLLSLKSPSDADTGLVICSCFQIKDAQIESAIRDGSDTLSALQKSLRCGTNCGSCIPELKGLIVQLTEPA